MEKAQLRAFERGAERCEQRLCSEHAGGGVSGLGAGAFRFGIVFPRPSGHHTTDRGYWRIHNSGLTCED